MGSGFEPQAPYPAVEVSRALVFDDPRRARGFYEALVADNIGIGRPEQIASGFAARPHAHV